MSGTLTEDDRISATAMSQAEVSGIRTLPASVDKLKRAVEHGLSTPRETLVDENDREDRDPTSQQGPNRFRRERTVDAFQTLQAWEGVVTEIFDSYFVARLVDKSSGNEEEAELPIDDVSPQDRTRLVVGNRLYWSIGYKTSATGQRSRESILLLRRHASVAPRSRTDAWIEKVSDSWLT